MKSITNALPKISSSGLYVWKKLSAKGGTFIDYVVSDSTDAYPDGGTQGGYWYEKVKNFMFGLIKEAHGSFIPSSNSKSYSITHNLGSKPKFIVIYTDASLLGKQYAIRSIQCVNRYSYDGTSTDNSMECIYIYNNTYYSDIEVYKYSEFIVKTADYDESTFNLSFSSSTSYFLTGATYYWQAMA